MRPVTLGKRGNKGSERDRKPSPNSLPLLYRFSIWSYKSKSVYSLQIEDVKADDAGYYRALIMYNNGMSKTDLYYKLTVTDKPSKISLLKYKS